MRKKLLSLSFFCTMMCLLAGCGHNGPYTATTANTVVTTEETE